MLKKYSPPYITILFLIIVANIIFSSAFIAFFLVGVVFKIFSDALRTERNNLLILSIITFLIIENTQGLKLFSLTLISMILYFVIIPRVKHFFSSSMILSFLFILFFYALFYLMVQISSPFDPKILILFVINFIVDIILVGFLF